MTIKPIIPSLTPTLSARIECAALRRECIVRAKTALDILRAHADPIVRRATDDLVELIDECAGTSWSFAPESPELYTVCLAPGESLYVTQDPISQTVVEKGWEDPPEDGVHRIELPGKGFQLYLIVHADAEEEKLTLETHPTSRARDSTVTLAINGEPVGVPLSRPHEISLGSSCTIEFNLFSFRLWYGHVE